MPRAAGIALAGTSITNQALKGLVSGEVSWSLESRGAVGIKRNSKNVEGQSAGRARNKGVK